LVFSMKYIVFRPSVPSSSRAMTRSPLALGSSALTPRCLVVLPLAAREDNKITESLVRDIWLSHPD